MRWCPNCKEAVGLMGYNIDLFHSCGCRTVPMTSELKRLSNIIDNRAEDTELKSKYGQLQAENKRLREERYEKDQYISNLEEEIQNLEQALQGKKGD